MKSLKCNTLYESPNTSLDFISTLKPVYNIKKKFENFKLMEKMKTFDRLEKAAAFDLNNNVSKDISIQNNKRPRSGKIINHHRRAYSIDSNSRISSALASTNFSSLRYIRKKYDKCDISTYSLTFTNNNQYQQLIENQIVNMSNILNSNSKIKKEKVKQLKKILQKKIDQHNKLHNKLNCISIIFKSKEDIVKKIENNSENAHISRKNYEKLNRKVIFFYFLNLYSMLKLCLKQIIYNIKRNSY